MDEERYEVPPQGSLGLLALGHIGLYAWRAAKKKHKEETGFSFQSFYSIEKPINSNSNLAADYQQPENEAS